MPNNQQLLFAEKQALDAEERELKLRAELLEKEQKRLEKTEQLNIPEEIKDNLETQKAKLMWGNARGKNAAKQGAGAGLIFGIIIIIVCIIILVAALGGGS